MTIQEIEEQLKTLNNEFQKLKEEDNWEPKGVYILGLNSKYEKFETALERNQIYNKFNAWLKYYHIAKYLNKGWVPDWNDFNQIKFFLYYDYRNKKWFAGCADEDSQGTNEIYFKTEKLAIRALEMMGDDMDYLK